MLTIWSNLQHECQTRAARVRHKQHECNTSETRATRVRHNCNTSATWTTWVWHKYNTSATRMIRVQHEWMLLILITTRVKIYFHIPIFTIWQVKNYKEWNNFIQYTTFGNVLFPCQNAFEKCTTKTELCNGKSCISYTLDCSCKLPCMFPHSYA